MAPRVNFVQVKPGKSRKKKKEKSKENKRGMPAARLFVREDSKILNLYCSALI